MEFQINLYGWLHHTSWRSSSLFKSGGKIPKFCKFQWVLFLKEESWVINFFFTVTVNDQPCNLVLNSVVYADDTFLLVSNKNEKVLLVLKSLFKLLSWKLLMGSLPINYFLTLIKRIFQFLAYHRKLRLNKLNN